MPLLRFPRHAKFCLFIAGGCDVTFSMPLSRVHMARHYAREAAARRSGARDYSFAARFIGFERAASEEKEAFAMMASPPCVQQTLPGVNAVAGAVRRRFRKARYQHHATHDAILSSRYFRYRHYQRRLESRRGWLHLMGQCILKPQRILGQVMLTCFEVIRHGRIICRLMRVSAYVRQWAHRRHAGRLCYREPCASVSRRDAIPGVVYLYEHTIITISLRFSPRGASDDAGMICWR